MVFESLEIPNPGSRIFVKKWEKKGSFNGVVRIYMVAI